IVPVGENYEQLVQIVRVVAGSLAKIAEVESDALATAVRERRLEGVPDEEIAMQLTASLDWTRFSRLTDYALRMQLRASARPELLPEARAGLAGGTVLAQEGDYYGPVVNLASRLVELARPGSVLASSELHAALADDPMFAWQRLRSRRIRDIGRVEVWALERAE